MNDMVNKTTDVVNKVRTVAIFRTKAEIRAAESKNKFAVSPAVYENPDFINAEENEKLGFKLQEGSDFTIIEVKAVKDDLNAFMEYAFGEVMENAVSTDK